jgi:hypothetical protein
LSGQPISCKSRFFDIHGVKIPVAVSAFAYDIYQAPKSGGKGLSQARPLRRFPFGCHFAWQQPRVFAEEMRVIQIFARLPETGSSTLLAVSHALAAPPMKDGPRACSM